MNILFVSPSFNPLDGTGWGSTPRTNLLFEACTQLGHVDVISFVDGVTSSREDCTVLYSDSVPKANQKEGRVMKFLRMLTPLNPYAMFPKNKRCAEIVKEFINKGNYDLIVCRYIPEAMMCGLYDYADKLVIDVDDNPCDVERTAARTSRTWRNRMYHRYRVAIIEKVVDKIQRACRFTFYANPVQAKYKNSAYLPNIPFYEYDLPLIKYTQTNPRLLFVGNMSYGPNAQGVDKFVENVFPLIRQQIPNVELHLVGGCNQQAYLDKWSEIKGVKYMGFVEDLKDEYREARIVVVPIYGGAGTNIKVLEAMQMRRPCVTTTYGVRGFSEYFSDSKELLIAEDDMTFAEKVVALMNDEKHNHDIATKAYYAMKAHFSRKAFNEIVKQSLLNTAC
jgi:glycosyltransferase involved in cell wall biosynthesis